MGFAATINKALDTINSMVGVQCIYTPASGVPESCTVRMFERSGTLPDGTVRGQYYEIHIDRAQVADPQSGDTIGFSDSVDRYAINGILSQDDFVTIAEGELMR